MGISSPFGGKRGPGESRKALFRHPVGNGLSWYAALARSEPVVDLHDSLRRPVARLMRVNFMDMREMCYATKFTPSL